MLAEMLLNHVLSSHIARPYINKKERKIIVISEPTISTDVC